MADEAIKAALVAQLSCFRTPLCASISSTNLTIDVEVRGFGLPPIYTAKCAGGCGNSASNAGDVLMVDNYNRLQGATATTVGKMPVRAATTENITLSGYQTIDGQTFGSSDESAYHNMRVLVWKQSDPKQNGIYLANSGAWTRTPDFDGNTDFVCGSTVYVTNGTIYGGQLFVVSSADPQSVGVNNITFSQFTITKNLSVEYFGVTPGLPSSGSASAVAAANTSAMTAALSYCASNGISQIFALSQYYVFSGAGIRIPDSVTIKGGGVGFWDPGSTSRQKTWAGTSFIAYGTGSKVESVSGITDRSATGGTRTDGVNTYKLTNLMNTDGSGTTPATAKAFSAFVAPLTRASGYSYASHWGLEDVRLVPWIGTDGISDWNDTGKTALAANWDVGLYSPDSEYECCKNVQVVGDWRIAALFRVQGDNSAATGAGGERGYYERCSFQGYRGVLLRAHDMLPVVATTVSTIDLPLTSSNWVPTSGQLKTASTTYTYTNTSSPGGGLLRLTGVTPDPSSVTAGTQMRVTYTGSGVSGTIFLGCEIRPLMHVSQQPATALGWSSPSLALEVDGYPLRRYVFISTRMMNQSVEPGNTFFGNCSDLEFHACQFENGSVIATPNYSDQIWAAYPVGDTRGMIWLRCDQTADLTLFTPRTFFDFDTIFPSSRNFSSTTEVITSAATRPLSIQNIGDLTYNNTAIGTIVAPSAYSWYLKGGVTNRLALFASGNFGAGVDNTQTFGTGSLRWSTIYAGTGAINTSDEREKQDIEEFGDAERRVAARLKRLLRKFRFKDAVTAKGNEARIHSGVIAQDVIAAFDTEGLDASRYGLLCHDAWAAEAETFNEDGTIASPARDAGERYGVRYEELFSFILAAL
jgi:hypothetical protein